MARKKIIIVTNHYKNIKNGVATVANSLINELSDDFSLLVICPVKEAKAEKGIELKTVSPSKFDISNHHWISFAWESSKIIRSLNEENYDLVIFLDAREGLFANRLKTPSLGIIHDFMSARFSYLSKELINNYPDWIKRYLYYKAIKKLEKKAYRRLTHLVTVSDYARNEIAKNYKISKQINVIGNGIELARLKKPTNKKEKNTVAFICGNPYLKGLPNLLKAVEQVAESMPDIKCYVIGKVEHMGTLPKKSPHAVFLGPLDYKDTMSCLDRSEVFCMPSRFESYGMVYLEALYYNMQVIASRMSGIVEIAPYFKNLHIVDPSNVSEIAMGIQRSLEKPAPIEKNHLSLISSETMGRKYAQLIKKLTNDDKA